MLYNACMCFLLSSSLLTLTTLGDYRQYRGKVEFNIMDTILFQGSIPKIQTENLTILCYTYLKLVVLPSWLLGFLLFSFIIIRYIRKLKVTYTNIAISLSIFNPICLQYFYFESKEFLSIFLFILILESKNIRNFSFSALFVLLRKENVFLLISKINMRGKLMLVLGMTLSIVIILDFYELSGPIFKIIELSFATDASTHRDWVTTPDKILSFEALNFFLIGAYTTIFVFFPFESYFLVFFPLGIAKIFLLIKVVNKFIFKDAFFLFIILGMYCIPLSVYNVGSSTRYVSVAWIALWLLLAIKENKKSNFVAIRVADRVLMRI